MEGRSSDMKEETYEGHRIEAHSIEYQSGGWPAEALVEWGEGGGIRTFGLPHPEGIDPFQTQDEAGVYAISMAKQWIDKGKPGRKEEGGASSSS